MLAKFFSLIYLVVDEMLHLKKYITYIALTIISIWTLSYYVWYHSTGATALESTWTCTGQGRSKICEFTNFCVDSHRGPFVISDKEPPQINVMNTEEKDDLWFQPRRISSHRKIRADHINETLFVYALYSPFHFSHALYNGLMPLYSIMQEKNASSASWSLRVGTFDNRHTEIDLLLPTTSKDIVLEKADVLTLKQTLPSYKPMCFSRAVVGAGNRCSLWYCDSQIPSRHYASFKSFALSQPVIPDNPCASSITTYKPDGQYKIGILNRKRTRHITNLPQLIQRLSDEVDAAVITIDFEKGCDIVNTAHVVKDLDVLIAPFGNGQGAGLFMKDDAVVISITARHYSEQWFKYVMTAVGRRIFDFNCFSPNCQEYDHELAESVLQKVGVQLKCRNF
ncbi:hypothetical protein [Parasitella parasitica]|uniref:Glycosyltransferase 61 catalytic domain-containing protein n=1 Tax=Parasitella parasitica TaxID=35722 RepID=A0A0B7NRQ6_9FUNG|nr:hypothetical protein [Parasitella parasitica]